jgi:phosphatidylglycerol:prolipoprotein diacylglycerol transferase
VIVALDPIVLSVGALAVRWFGLLAVAGLGLAGWLTLRALRRHGLAPAPALDALVWALPAAVLVGRLVHVLGWWDYYFTHPWELWQLNVDGLSLWGGLLGGLAFGLARLRGDPPLRRRVLDVAAPYVALGIAIGRLGAFVDGHGQGLPADLPWATQYVNRLASSPDFGVPRHPAQVYDGLIALALCGLLCALPRRLAAGTRVAAFFVVYGTARLLLGAVQLDPAFLFGLQIEQLLALGGIGFGLIYGARGLVPFRKATRPAASGRPRPTEDPLAA